MTDTTPPTAPDVSVVICAYTEERWADLTAAVESIRRQSVTPREIVVVVDHNPPLLARVRASLPGVRAAPNRQGRGLSGARNSGVAASHGAAIAFLDDDAQAAPDWLANLTAHFTSPQVAGVGALVRPRWDGPRPAWFPAEFNWVVGCAYTGLPQATATVRNLFGGCMCVRREVFAVAGGFRGEMGRGAGRPLGCEETEFCIRAQQRRPDWVFVYEPRACATHRVPAQRATWDYFRERCFAEGLSKARLSALVGLDAGLSAERTYAGRTLPRGLARGLADTFRRGDLTGLLRAGAIAAGLGYTAAGFAAGRLARGLSGGRSRAAEQAA